MKMKNSSFSFFEFTSLLLVSFVYIIKCPFNKVEESFNTHAVNDVINKFPQHLPQEDINKNFNQQSVLKLNQTWDHVVFPGVVPRTFVGSMFIGLIMKIPTTFLQNNDNTQLNLQIASRFLLATLVAISLIYLSSIIHKQFGFYHRICFFFLTISQFHYLFYAGRLLPNTFAAILSNIVFAFWINRKYSNALTYIALCVIIFRFDSCIFFGWLILETIVVRRQLSFSRLITIGIPSGILAIFVTFTIDSMLWVRPVWPELESLYFNLWLNKSHEWGHPTLLMVFLQLFAKNINAWVAIYLNFRKSNF